MPVPEIFSAPNLISLTRVTMLPVMWYYLSQEGRTAVVFCAAIMAWAGISDALDGYLARRLNQVGKLGILLDPLCDKIFAVALVLMLIPYRDFPIWLAIVILGRDLLILLGGLYLNRKKPVSLPSNLVGKYAFAVMAMLLTSYVIEYPLGVWLFAPLTLAFIAASLVGYGRVFLKVSRGETPQPFQGPYWFKIARIAVTVLVLAVWFVGLWV